jgi:hypothetical protein
MAKEFTYYNPSSTITWRDSTPTENDDLGLENSTTVLIHDIELNEPYQTDYSWDIKLVMSNWNSAFLWLNCDIPNSFNNINNYYHVVIEDITDGTEVLKKVWHDSIEFEQDTHGIEIITFHEYKIKIYQVKDQYKEIHPSYSDSLWWESDVFEFPYIFINYDFVGSLCSIDIRNKYIPSLNTSNNHYCLRDTSMTQTPRFFMSVDGLSFQEEILDINNKSYTKYNYLYKDMDLSFSGDLPTYFTDPANLTKLKYNIGYKYDRYITGVHQNSKLSSTDEDYKLELVDITSPTNVEYNSTDGYYYINRKMDHEFKVSCIIHNDAITSVPSDPNTIKTYNTSFDDSHVSFIESNLQQENDYIDGSTGKVTIYLPTTNYPYINNDLYFIHAEQISATWGSFTGYNIDHNNHKIQLNFNSQEDISTAEYGWYCIWSSICSSHKRSKQRGRKSDFKIDVNIRLIDIFNNQYIINFNTKTIVPVVETTYSTYKCVQHWKDCI